MVSSLTTRLSMEALAPTHAGLLLEGLSDPRLYVYIPEDPPASLTALTARFEQLAAGSPRADEVWRNWVMRLASDGRPVGTLQASVYADHHATIAYLVLPALWNQGLAREGVSWMLEQISRQDQVGLAEAFIDTRNRASLRVVEGTGFRCRATIVNADNFKGHASDEHVYEKVLTRPGERR